VEQQHILVIVNMDMFGIPLLISVYVILLLLIGYGMMLVLKITACVIMPMDGSKTE